MRGVGDVDTFAEGLERYADGYQQFARVMDCPSSLLSRPRKCQAAGQDSVDGVTTELKVLNLLIRQSSGKKKASSLLLEEYENVGLGG